MSIHQLRVTLLEVGPPPVWRRVHVPSRATLADLHRVLQAVMGWEDYHLHSFETGWDRYGHQGEAETVALAAVLPTVGGRLAYVYGFGDHWLHEVELEKIHRPAPRVRYPRCTAGRGACPPEDSGGPHGYDDLQRALRSRKGWRYQHAREHFGRGRWDPAAFDLTATDAALDDLRPPLPEPTTTVVSPGAAGRADPAAAVRAALDVIAGTPTDPAALPAGVDVALARLRAAHTARRALDAEIDQADRPARTMIESRG
ncbi:plasmid pRiA4b ORF-3 family protein [Candidatus Frankia alpina]|uniref:plasmid pRiA4b ORF-3 family protein n=1 Tax=Candidatus Frankia alpina TaxID=2699483 RepID=UPI0013D61650|nr:plasmid pRiA4b ORF-3 family protein [Candidatus Frankia alpina]